MVSAAADAGLEAIGITDHCNVSSRDAPNRAKRKLGFNLDLTYERRRAAIDALRERSDPTIADEDETGLTIYDAVELDYDPRDEREIADFLEEAAFDYAIGSVHELDGANIFNRGHFGGKSDDELRALVDEYYDQTVSLIESELFDVVGHVDAIERTPELRGYTRPEHYDLVAEALAPSSTLPEINAGRAVGDEGYFHPAPEFVEALRGRDVRFVPGTDSHRPDEIADRLPILGDRFEEFGLEPATPFE